MSFAARRHSDGTIDFDHYRRRAAMARRERQATFMRGCVLAARNLARTCMASYRSLVRSRCQPTVASGLASTEAK